jgi:hypothetical protein
MPALVRFALLLFVVALVGPAKAAGSSPLDSDGAAAVLEGCREHIAFGLGDSREVRNSVPPAYRLLAGPEGRPVLFLNALRCQRVLMDGTVRPLTASLVAAVVKSPDGHGCASRLPVLGSGGGDVLPLCNLYVLREIFDDARVLDAYRAGAVDYPVSHVPSLRLDHQAMLGSLQSFTLEAPGLSWKGMATDAPTTPVPFHVPLWWEPDARSPHAVVTVDFERLGAWTGAIHASPGSEWWRWFGGPNLLPLAGPLAAGPSGTWDGSLRIERSTRASMNPGYPCDQVSVADAATALSVGPGDVIPGERYPSTGDCVFWTKDGSGAFLIARDARRGPREGAWSCAEEQSTPELSVRRRGHIELTVCAR